MFHWSPAFAEDRFVSADCDVFEAPHAHSHVYASMVRLGLAKAQQYRSSFVLVAVDMMRSV